ncbi:MAG: methyltransferase domain-containing protein [Thermodesulfobacteriota bacterium]|nr:methyltransferase domain-containing protein [Thermodesulfobacteriota bacterium]
MEHYVHGYEKRESTRLVDQANTFEALLHGDTAFPPGSSVLEAGCGTGAQTIILAKNSPGAHITAIDTAQDSLTEARTRLARQGISHVSFELADIYDLPFDPESFDHVFVCFVLEHLAHPLAACKALRGVLKKGGAITVIEGDHGSFYCHPQSREAQRTVQCLIDIQAHLKGNALIGRQLYPLLHDAGFAQTAVSPRMVYVDASKPYLVEGFTRRTFIAMVEGVKEQALSMDMMDEGTWDKGISDLYRTTQEDGTFCYTFFKGTGLNL